MASGDAGNLPSKGQMGFNARRDEVLRRTLFTIAPRDRTYFRGLVDALSRRPLQIKNGAGGITVVSTSDSRRELTNSLFQRPNMLTDNEIRRMRTILRKAPFVRREPGRHVFPPRRAQTYLRWSLKSHRFPRHFFSDQICQGQWRPKKR